MARSTQASRMWLRAAIVVCVAVGLPSGAWAQENPVPWVPSEGAVGASWGGYGTDSETMRRAGVWWARSPRSSLGLTGAFWGGYRHLEVESRWFLAEERLRASPFLQVSATWQQRGHQVGVGPGVAAGVEYYPARPAAVTAALGWRSLYNRWRVDGYSREPADLHWFTVRFEFALYTGS